jgi:hypothetical protein
VAKTGRKPGYNKTFAVAAMIIAAAVVLLIVCKSPIQKACTMEALQCPDGSYVGRNSSNDCKFDPCPGCNCPNGYLQEGAACNPKCYYNTPKCLAPSLLCS